MVKFPIIKLVIFDLNKIQSAKVKKNKCGKN
jgi:hypothetical protein